MRKHGSSSAIAVAIIDRDDAPGYARFLGDLKQRIAGSRLSVARAVNREMILLYWDIGCGIVGKQSAAGWGDSVVERLAGDLRAAFPGMSGFSGRNLRDMRRLFLSYSDPEFWRQAVAKLTPAMKRQEF